MKVLVADDDFMFRSFMRRILGAQPDLTLVGEAIDADEVVQFSRRLQPDVVLMSIHLPGGAGWRQPAASKLTGLRFTCR